ncbi:catechol 2,3-dioxygenase-like lactoylglutathione lyase family enzyme [Natronocella acetinitrilica]|uniref:Catechol 2,3-dioxygenase-like lactoylglutathione lyase family enzyme n=1 Tax=Natronocella acetinitrilica TaxID=414046 RepID=A0AAE3G690_9GAMM|nr:hypothetical protein [Natronocella acetinitrilica]MCP1675506.1 catechol 2,3-dioxygenase-like lactoylglutathione lyase family enzyme [Natronocella acetinitrilica]
MRRFHIAIGVADIAASVEDYTQRLGQEPVLVIAGEYALWRTDRLNLSIRYAPAAPGELRHLGWEDPQAETLSIEHDVNGLVWERFSAHDQAAEIAAIWPASNYKPDF